MPNQPVKVFLNRKMMHTIANPISIPPTTIYTPFKYQGTLTGASSIREKSNSEGPMIDRYKKRREPTIPPKKITNLKNVFVLEVLCNRVSIFFPSR